PTSIHHQSCPGDKSGSIGRQKYYGAHKVLNCTEPTQLDPPQHIGMKRLVLPEWLGQWRIDESRADGVHPNAVGRQVDCHCLGQTLDAVLAHAVDRAPSPADVAHLGGNMDD